MTAIPAVPSEPPLTDEAALSDAELVEIAQIRLEQSQRAYKLESRSLPWAIRFYLEDMPRVLASLRSAREELMSARAERQELIAERDQARADLSEDWHSASRCGERPCPGCIIEDLVEQKAAAEGALAGAEQSTTDARRELASVTDQRDRLRNKLIPKGFGRWNQHCMSCGDERGGPFGHETSECRYKPGMTATEVAELLPEHRRAEFWELCVERYLAMELETHAEALAADVPAAPASTVDASSAGSLTPQIRISETEGQDVRRTDPAETTSDGEKPQVNARRTASDVPAAADHEHPGGYLSTACLHELHEPECGAAQRARGDNSHPHCKYCGAKCVCGCHTGGQVERAERVHVDGCTLAADDPHHAGWCKVAVGDVPAKTESCISGEAYRDGPSGSWAWRCDACGGQSHPSFDQQQAEAYARNHVPPVPAAGEAEADRA